MRSAICGRSSPSSGFMVPINMNRAGWLREIALAFDYIHPQGGRIQENVDDVIVQ